MNHVQFDAVIEYKHLYKLRTNLVMVPTVQIVYKARLMFYVQLHYGGGYTLSL